MSELNEILKKSKEDVINHWNDGEKILDRIEGRKSTWKIWTSAVATICLLVISYSLFDNSQVPRTLDTITIGDLYGDETTDSGDELDDTFEFYGDLV